MSSVSEQAWPHPLGTRGPQGGFSLNVLIFRGALQGRAIALALCDTLLPGDGPRGKVVMVAVSRPWEQGEKPASSSGKSSEPLFVLLGQ